MLLNEHAGTKVPFTGAGGHEGEVTGGLVPGVAPWGPLAVVDARGRLRPCYSLPEFTGNKSSQGEAP